MIPFNRQLIAATRPIRYAFNATTFQLFGSSAPIASLKDIYRDKPMLVVGNGPSLNHTPLDDFADIPSIGMNKIDLIYARTKWRPKIIVCLNNLVAKQNQEIFFESEIPVFIAWKARMYLTKNSRKKLNFYSTTYSNSFSTDAVKGFGSSVTVTYVALQMAYWMGANPVIVLGVDHSFKFSGSKLTYQKREGADENHFDPNYFAPGTYWGTPDLAQAECDYRIAATAYKNDGRKIYDATIDGQLNVFEKISISKALDLVK